MSRFTKPSKRAAVLCVAAVLVAGGGGAAFAYWSSMGEGAGTATTGTSAQFTVTSSAPVGAPLAPGGAQQSVDFVVANPSTATLVLTSVVVTVANADGSAWVAVPGCSAADYAVDAPVVTYGSIVGGDDIAGTVSVGMVDTGVSQDACKGVTVPLYFVAS